MSRPLNLYRLQQVDSQIDQANNRLKEIAALLAENSNLRKATVLSAKTEKTLVVAQKKLRQAETKVKDQRIKIEQTESILYGGTVRNPKELRDLQNEVDALKRFLDILEERQLEAMLAVDEAEEKHQESLKILTYYRDKAKKQQTSLLQEREQLQNEISALQKQQTNAAQVILPKDLETYNRLRKQRAGIAVASVNNRACSACGATLTASLHQAARSPSQVVFCDSCGRILCTI